LTLFAPLFLCISPQATQEEELQYKDEFFPSPIQWGGFRYYVGPCLFFPPFDRTLANAFSTQTIDVPSFFSPVRSASFSHPISPLFPHASSPDQPFYQPSPESWVFPPLDTICGESFKIPGVENLLSSTAAVPSFLYS